MVRREQQLVAYPQGAGLDAAREDAAVLHAINILNRKSQRLVRDRFGWFELIDRLKNGRPVKPTHRPLGIVRDIRAHTGGNRHKGARIYPELFKESAIFCFYFL